MYVYCLYNPIAYYDNGYCALSWQNGYQGPCPGIGKPGCMDNSYFEAARKNKIDMDCMNFYTIITSTAEVGVKAPLEIGKYAAKTSTAPANIGAGIYAKQMNAKIAKIDKALLAVDRCFTLLAYVSVPLETCINMDMNCRAGASIGKIAWDATVDTLILGTNTYLSVAAGAAIGTTILPGVGTTVGAIIGIVISIALDITSEEPRRYMKSWIQ